MSNYLWSIDEGHGSIGPNGAYTTPASKGKQYTFTDTDPHLEVYEGYINRQVGKFLKKLLLENSIDYEAVNHLIMDTPLRERVEKIDNIFHREREKGRPAILLSIHSNAMTKKEEISGAGQEIASYNSVWTSVGQTKSDLIAPFFVKSYEDNLPEWRMAHERGDGDDDFESDFYILRKSDGPAVLMESLFFDNRKNAEFLVSEEGQRKIAKTLFEAILECESIKPI